MILDFSSKGDLTCVELKTAAFKMQTKRWKLFFSEIFILFLDVLAF